MSPFLRALAFLSLSCLSLLAAECDVSEGTCAQRDETSLLQVKKDVTPGSKRSEASADVHPTAVLVSEEAPVRSAGAALKELPMEVLKESDVKQADTVLDSQDAQYPGAVLRGVPLGMQTGFVPGLGGYGFVPQASPGVVAGDFVPASGSGAVSGYVSAGGSGVTQGYAPAYAAGYSPALAPSATQGYAPAYTAVVMHPGVATGMAPGVAPYATGYAPGLSPGVAVAGLQPGFAAPVMPGASYRAAAVAAQAGAQKVVAQTAATVAENVAAKATVQQAAAQNAAAYADAFHNGYPIQYQHQYPGYPIQYQHQYPVAVQVVRVQDAADQVNYPVYQQTIADHMHGGYE